jgi:hypothetical protein
MVEEDLELGIFASGRERMRRAAFHTDLTKRAGLGVELDPPALLGIKLLVHDVLPLHRIPFPLRLSLVEES